MFRVNPYPMISKIESGQVGYRKKYRVSGRVRVPAGHWIHPMDLNENTEIPCCETDNCNLMDPSQGALDHDAILEVSYF